MKQSKSRWTFLTIDVILLLLYAIAALFPLLHLAALSVSEKAFVDAGSIILIPKGLNFNSYAFIFQTPDFFRAFGNTLLRLALGVPLNLLCTLLAAYPLSRPKKSFDARSFFSWFYVITMLISGGTVPTLMLINALGLRDTIWALVLPGAVPVFNVVLMINFLRQIPEELHEAAEIDAASEIRILFTIYVPLCVASIATITLFIIVAHWNSWNDAVLYMSTISKYPLQAYLQSVVFNSTDIGSINNPELVASLNKTTVDSARLFLAVIPVAIMYFPLQRYFVKGLTLGGVKG